LEKLVFKDGCKEEVVIGNLLVRAWQAGLFKRLSSNGPPNPAAQTVFAGNANEKRGWLLELIGQLAPPSLPVVAS